METRAALNALESQEAIARVAAGETDVPRRICMTSEKTMCLSLYVMKNSGLRKLVSHVCHEISRSLGFPGTRLLTKGPACQNLRRDASFLTKTVGLVLTRTIFTISWIRVKAGQSCPFRPRFTLVVGPVLISLCTMAVCLVRCGKLLGM